MDSAAGARRLCGGTRYQTLSVRVDGSSVGGCFSMCVKWCGEGEGRELRIRVNFCKRPATGLSHAGSPAVGSRPQSQQFTCSQPKSLLALATARSLHSQCVERGKYPRSHTTIQARVILCPAITLHVSATWLLDSHTNLRLAYPTTADGLNNHA